VGRPHGRLLATRAKFFGEGDQDGVDIFGAFVGSCGVEWHLDWKG
jgi:hypothetical protein